MGRAESGMPRPPGLGTLAMRYDDPALRPGMTGPDELWRLLTSSALEDLK